MGSVPYGYGEVMELGTVRVSGGKVTYSDRWPKGECWLPDAAIPNAANDDAGGLIVGDPRTDPELFLRGWGNGPKKRSWNGQIDGLHWGWWLVYMAMGLPWLLRSLA